jgi:hypothetical protein
MKFPDYGIVLWSLSVEIVPGKQENTAISAPTLPKERELSSAHAQRCIFLNMEQCCGPMTLEVIPGNHCEFSTYLAKSAIAQSGARAEVQFPDYGTELWSPGSRKCSRKALQYQHLSCQENECSVWSMRRGADS